MSMCICVYMVPSDRMAAHSGGIPSSAQSSGMMGSGFLTSMTRIKWLLKIKRVTLHFCRGIFGITGDKLKSLSAILIQVDGHHH